MTTPTPRLPQQPDASAQCTMALFDLESADGLASDTTTANQLPAEQQLTRFLHWLQLTDRGHQPC